MRTETKEVRSQAQVLGVCSYDQYDSLEEARSHMGEDKCLDLINAQVRTNQMNNFRTSRTKGPSKKVLRTKAINEIMQEFAGGAHQQIIGDEHALEALIETRMAAIEENLRSAFSDEDDDD